MDIWGLWKDFSFLILFDETTLPMDQVPFRGSQKQTQSLRMIVLVHPIIHWSLKHLWQGDWFVSEYEPNW